MQTKNLLILVREAKFSDSYRGVAVALELNGSIVSTLEMMIRGDRDFALLSGVRAALQAFDTTILTPVDKITVSIPISVIRSSEKGGMVYDELTRRAPSLSFRRWIWRHSDTKKTVRTNLAKLMVS